MAKKYVIYDERAMYDEDEASIYCVADTEDEAREDAEDFSPCVIFEYTDDNGVLTDGSLLEYVS